MVWLHVCSVLPGVVVFGILPLSCSLELGSLWRQHQHEYIGASTCAIGAIAATLGYQAPTARSLPFLISPLRLTSIVLRFSSLSAPQMQSMVPSAPMPPVGVRPPNMPNMPHMPHWYYFIALIVTVHKDRLLILCCFYRPDIKADACAIPWQLQVRSCFFCGLTRI